MPSSRGFDKAGMIANVPRRFPAAAPTWWKVCTARGTRSESVPAGSQSGLRIIVLFTDGASNSVPGFYDSPGDCEGDEDVRLPAESRRHVRPDLEQSADHRVLRHGNRHDVTTPTAGFNPTMVWNSTALPAGLPVAARLLPVGNVSAHTHHRSPGIPTSFPLPDQRFERGWRSAERGARTAQSRCGRQISQPGLEHQQRRQKPRRDHRERGAER